MTETNKASNRVLVTSPQTRAARKARPRSPVVELREQTDVGEVLIRSLIRAQLGLAIRILVIFASLLGGLPLLFALAPEAGRYRLWGVPLPWIVLGVLSFPLLILLGVLYVRLAERNEADFVDLVEHP